MLVKIYLFTIYLFFLLDRHVCKHTYLM